MHAGDARTRSLEEGLRYSPCAKRLRVFAWLVIAAACGPGTLYIPATAAANGEDERAGEKADEHPDDATATTAADGLAGTAWQLVRITTTDPATHQATGSDTAEPRNPAEYTLRFDADGRVAVRADCNRGGGSWTTDGASLSFGPLAMTRVMCPPGSLHDRFVAALASVRSFVLADGRLRLAAPADGPVIEFEPLAE